MDLGLAIETLAWEGGKLRRRDEEFIVPPEGESVGDLVACLLYISSVNSFPPPILILSGFFWFFQTEGTHVHPSLTCCQLEGVGKGEMSLMDAGRLTSYQWMLGRGKS